MAQHRAVLELLDKVIMAALVGLVVVHLIMAVAVAVSDVIRNPGHFSIAFVFAYNRE